MLAIRSSTQIPIVVQHPCGIGTKRVRCRYMPAPRRQRTRKAQLSVNSEFRDYEIKDGRVLGGQIVRSTWLEVPVGDRMEWIAAYRLMRTSDGSPAIAEVRVFPNEVGRQKAGEWSAVSLGSDAKIPAGGLPSQIVHSLTPARDLRQHWPSIAGEWEQHGGQAGDFTRQGFSAPLNQPPKRRPGRAGLGKLHHAKWAARYAATAERSRRPILDMWEEEQKMGHVWHSQEWIRDTVAEARRRKLLTRTPKGRAGGTLTAKAKRLLREVDDESGEEAGNE
jgi:hypothetical protein